MRRFVSAVMILLLAVVHAPTQAQALFFDLLPPDLRQLGTSEPVTLLLTGIALLSLGRIGPVNQRGPDGSQIAVRTVRSPRSRRLRLPAVAGSEERAA